MEGKIKRLNNFKMYKFLTNFNYILFSFIFLIVKSIMRKQFFLVFFFFHPYFLGTKCNPSKLIKKNDFLVFDFLLILNLFFIFFPLFFSSLFFSLSFPSNFPITKHRITKIAPISGYFFEKVVKSVLPSACLDTLHIF